MFSSTRDSHRVWIGAPPKREAKPTIRYRTTTFPNTRAQLWICRAAKKLHFKKDRLMPSYGRTVKQAPFTTTIFLPEERILNLTGLIRAWTSYSIRPNAWKDP